MKKISLKVSKPYDIIFTSEPHANADFLNILRNPKRKFVIVTDTIVESLWGRAFQKQLNCDLISFPAGELHKTRETKQRLEDQLLASGYSRDTCLIAFGGGVVTDLTGFLASTYLRGIPYISVPTSLLAMVDASIGGKTAVNTAFGKNLIGSFHQPEAVFINTQYLSTLPEREWANGLAEMIKHAVIADGSYFEELQLQSGRMHELQSDFIENAIYRSCLIKKDLVEQDEFDTGARQLLNFGHTVGHAVEAITHFEIPHGYAIALGMLAETQISISKGICQTATLQRLHHLLTLYRIPLYRTVLDDRQALLTAMMADKKATANQINMVLLSEIGKPYSPNQRYAHPIASNMILEEDYNAW